MNKESMPARKAGEGVMERQGDFTFDEDFSHIYLWLPGQRAPDCLRIQRGRPGGDRVWGWNEDVDKPTLEPSIHVQGERGWHGHLRAGHLQSC